MTLGGVLLGLLFMMSLGAVFWAVESWRIRGGKGHGRTLTALPAQRQPGQKVATPERTESAEPNWAQACKQVLGELEGEGLTPELLSAALPPFLDGMGDPRKAGVALAGALAPVPWDWPRWQPYAKRDGYDRVADFMALDAGMGLHALLHSATKAELVALGAMQQLAVPSKLTKAKMIEQLMGLPTANLQTWETLTREVWRTKQLMKVRRHMGERLASRAMHIAIEKNNLRQRSEPGYTRFHPYWRFICPEDAIESAPKKCRDLNQKVLLAEQARSAFPSIPCARIDCCCRITTQTREDSHEHEASAKSGTALMA